MRLLLIPCVLLFSASFAVAAPTVGFTITGGKADAAQVVVVLPLKDKIPPTEAGVVVTATDGKTYPAQWAEGNQLVVYIPQLKAGQVLALEAKFGSKPTPDFVWHDADGKAPELRYLDKTVLGYVRPEFDPKATPPKKGGNANPTIKIYHHLYAADGTTRLTNAAEGQYPHHRGIYYGFNKVSYGDKTADIWHCTKGEHQSHDKVLLSEGGPLFGRQELAVNWHGQDDRVFATETRTLTVYHATGGTLLEFDSLLKTTLPKVKLDGDPQHAGFHFRAAQDVEKNPKETYFLRPDGKGEKGKETNWDPKSKAGPKNLPWDAMSFVVAQNRYTVLYLDHPDNPKEARQSERTYGRIGTYFEYELTPEKPLHVKYRLWVQPGELTVEQCEAMSKAFTETIGVKVTAK